MPDTEPANARQVGGEHYRSDMQHWDLMETVGARYLEGSGTKYVTRFRDKGGAVDLGKAIHYTDKIIETYDAREQLPWLQRLLTPRRRPARRDVTEREMDEFARANGLCFEQREAVRALLTHRSRADLILAKRCIDCLAADPEVRSGRV